MRGEGVLVIFALHAVGRTDDDDARIIDENIDWTERKFALANRLPRATRVAHVAGCRPRFDVVRPQAFARLDQMLFVARNDRDAGSARAEFAR